MTTPASQNHTVTSGDTRKSSSGGDGDVNDDTIDINCYGKAAIGCDFVNCSESKSDIAIVSEVVALLT